ncbi:RTA1 like protein-domain-containing protein [Aspergillus caelatus]|uniref:RTA1 like protein-domain-containing protein n=2 Tax=Aspergillus subgen. Circumdati TaxID=2720871 RepID=A0A5N6ZL27_9EURO|nr:RTA1 like protein-domain-containing protein [Aspergillus caelatus]KAE8357509.1 RTA1 like protein-domain-containing protein [Aspergillus caelatus]KAE8422891.1 RTA1 like protein-domain-containing protein [Aspergillus pseudocaelatus]
MASYQTCTEVTPLCPVEATTYGYYPNYGGNIFFTVFYGLCGVFQLGFGIYFRSWTLMVALVVGTLLEMAGYIGRVLMNKNPWDGGAFKLQIVAIILGPTFIAAGIYLTLKHIILSLGPEHSRLKPKLFTWIFIGCDIGSLILQAAGGGVAAAAGSDQRDLLNAGNDIIITGIAFQVATMSVCGLLALDFFIRYLRRGSGEKALDATNGRNNIKLVVIADTFAYFTVLIRCIYRIPEMAGGWGNPLMQKEDEFLVLDGMMVALAVLALTVFHPGLFLPSLRKGNKNVEAA